MSEAHFWLGFSLIPNVGAQGVAQLRQAFGDLQTAWEAAEPSLALAGLNAQTVENITGHRSRIDVNAEWRAIERGGAHVVIQTDPRYPPLLRGLGDAPPILTVRGMLEPDAMNLLTIVGTREATPYGIDLAYAFAKALASSGVTIVSGFARGIDAAAHTGALDGGGRTIAVLGNGIDVLYPSEHAALKARITEQGALVSEFKHDARPDKGRFPRRNRTMSGMSRGVLIIEAPSKSGALLTAKAAREQGRMIFVVRGEAGHPNQGGIEALIAAGAMVVTHPNDILTAWGNSSPRTDSRQVKQPKPQPTPNGARTPAQALSPEARRILDVMNDQALHVDEIARQTSIPMNQILGIMTSLEMDEQVQIVGHSQYRRRIDAIAGQDDSL